MRACRGVVVAALAAMLGCGAAAFDGRVYRDAHVAFGVAAVPEAWRALRVTDAKLAFRDDALGASVLVTARCDVAADDVPLASLTAQLIMGTTQREYVTEALVPFDGREAQHTVMAANLDGVRMRYDLFVMKKNGCVYDLAYVVPPEHFEVGAPTFEAFAKGFRALDADAPRAVEK